MDLLDLGQRKRLLDDINSEENRQRKAKSQKEFDVFKGIINKYVVEYLKQQFSHTTVKEMPIISSINLAKRVVVNEASVYKNEPDRIFMNTSEQQSMELQNLYSAMNVDSKMMKLNAIYKLQQQALMQVIPKDGKMVMRCFYAHQYDVIPNDIDPEIADGYIISVFDKQNYNDAMSDSQSVKQKPLVGNVYRDTINQSIADQDDYKASLERYVVWTRDLNFIMNGKGEILSENIESPLADYQMMPFIDVAMDKDFEYFVRGNDGVVDFTVQYNGALSDLANVVKMQGWGQAYIKGDKDLMPEALVVGINHVLRLPIDPNSKVETEFGFVTPNANIDGSIKYVEMLISNFLSSKGLDVSMIATNSGAKQSYSSGVERLLSQIEKFEASKADFALFKNIESKLFDLLKVWSKVVDSSVMMDIPDAAEIVVNYFEPTMIQSAGEKTDLLIKQVESGFKSRVDAVMELHGVDKDMATQMIQEIDSVPLLNQDQSVDKVINEVDVVDEKANVDFESNIEKDFALNGAQVTSMVDVVSKAAAGLLPRDSAVSIIENAFNIERSVAEKIVGKSGSSFKVSPDTI